MEVQYIVRFWGFWWSWWRLWGLWLTRWARRRDREIKKGGARKEKRDLGGFPPSKGVVDRHLKKWFLFQLPKRCCFGENVVILLLQKESFHADSIGLVCIFTYSTVNYFFFSFLFFFIKIVIFKHNKIWLVIFFFFFFFEIW